MVDKVFNLNFWRGIFKPIKQLKINSDRGEQILD